MSASASPRVLVLGIGNLLWADEGFGVRCVEALAERFEFPEQVTLMDGGTQGLYLLPYVEEADCLLVFDAVDYGDAPGTLREVCGAEVPRFMGAKKMSLHQTGFQEVLSLAQLTGRYPQEVLLIGCQPEQLDDYGGSLRPVVKLAMQEALQLAVQTLQDWGAQPVLRDPAPTTRQDKPTLDALAMAAYEAQRPSAADACRSGDARFFPNTKEH